MSATTTYFTQAELALAAYSKLTLGMTVDAYKAALRDDGNGLSFTQAALFAQTYSVAAVCNASNGLSATVFVNNTTGERCLAIRGTNDLKDVLSDIVDIALLGTTALQSQYASLKAQVQEWINTGVLSAGFTVTGHSLGGFLATGITADFATKVSHTYLYNAPGVGGLVGTFLSALGVTSTVDSAKISNIKAEAGPSLIAGLGTQVSTPIPVEIEDQTASDITNSPAALNHSQQVLTDALAVQSAYAALDPNLTQAQLNALIDASGNNANDILESALDGIRKLLLGPTTAKTSTDRNATDGTDLYTNLYALQNGAAYKALLGKATIVPFAAVSSDTLVVKSTQTDAEGLAYRYALTALNPFAILGADYSAHNTDGALDLYNPTSHTGELTAQFLADRAEFLARKTWFNTQDIAPVNPGYQYNSTTNGYQNDDSLFIDAASGYTIAQGFNPSSPHPNIHRYYFGDAQDNTYTGGEVSDALYGGGGADSLNGGADADYLEGGAGNDTLLGGTGDDTYVFASGDGWDTIEDTDGLGRITYDGVPLTGGDYISPNVWQKKDANGQVQYTYVLTDDQGDNGQSLKRLTIEGPNGGVMIKGWQAGRLGLTLPGAPGGSTAPTLPPESGTVIAGGANASYLDLWGNHTNFNGGSFSTPVFNANMQGGSGAAYIDANDAGNNIQGGAGNNTLEGGSGKRSLINVRQIRFVDVKNTSDNDPDYRISA